jgi:hypothetical protein
MGKSVFPDLVDLEDETHGYKSTDLGSNTFDTFTLNICIVADVRRVVNLERTVALVLLLSPPHLPFGFSIITIAKTVI